MREIKLSQGLVTLVDDEDFYYLNHWNWYACKIGKTYYAMRGIKLKGRKTTISMHRVIMNTPCGLLVDHIDHNGLNNQKSNLRNCNYKENCRNRIGTSTTGYKGVYFARGRYYAQITLSNSKPKHLGFFKTAKDAAIKYNEVASMYFGEFVSLNVI